MNIEFENKNEMVEIFLFCELSRLVYDLREVYFLKSLKIELDGE